MDMDMLRYTSMPLWATNRKYDTTYPQKVQHLDHF